MDSRFRIAKKQDDYKPLRAKKKKKIKVWTYIRWTLAVIVILAAAFAFASFFIFKAEDVEYSGGEHYTKEELNSLIFGTDTPNVLHYSIVGEKDKKIPFIEKYDVDIKWPDKISVTVYEKSIVGYISYMGCNMFFDREGMVVESSLEHYENVPEIYGLKFDSIVLNNKLEIGNEEVFDKILDLTQAFDKYKLDINKIVFKSNFDVVLNMGDVKVLLGNPQDFTERLYVLKQLSSEFEGLKGTLHLEEYDGTESSIIFTKEK